MIHGCVCSKRFGDSVVFQFPSKMKEALGKLFRGQLAFQRQVASHISDLANKVLELEGLLEKAGEREAEANEKIVTMERARESMAVKASRQETVGEHVLTCRQYIFGLAD